eukprot:scaffold11075_cov53-Phaeocystis_antarctica.AAC.2
MAHAWYVYHESASGRGTCASEGAARQPRTPALPPARAPTGGHTSETQLHQQPSPDGLRCGANPPPQTRGVSPSAEWEALLSSRVPEIDLDFLSIHRRVVSEERERVGRELPALVVVQQEALDELRLAAGRVAQQYDLECVLAQRVKAPVGARARARRPVGARRPVERLLRWSHSAVRAGCASVAGRLVSSSRALSLRSSPTVKSCEGWQRTERPSATARSRTTST